MLTLPIKRKYFDMIENDIKGEEYRDTKPYYDARFRKLNFPITLRLRAGYRKDSPLMECVVRITLGVGREDWGAVPGKVYYVLKILEHKRVRNITTSST